jgi:hypothetical protein
MKLDTGTKLILALVLALPALWFPGMLAFWCVFAVVSDVFKEAAERHDAAEALASNEEEAS